nr:MAG TPA: Mor transcription activator family [Caudoviricetes sp.]
MAISDVKYVKMYQDYNAMLGKGYKKAYIVALLKDEYNINERTVYRIIERFQKEIKL